MIRHFQTNSTIGGENRYVIGPLRIRTRLRDASKGRSFKCQHYFYVLTASGVDPYVIAF